ncbi:uncharacterized protein LOC114171679 [Vigna unguiculata]|uniref:uncharacterized protein LOC114171679 n=1 Tax=Vigna unguiculata TaxID=3917 RepID=UPI0010171DE5|nr:uncharacterized protein LOC114171679 [Vigna unguiculata]
MSFSSSPMHVDRHNSVHLDRHCSQELHHTIHSDIPFFGEDIGPISFKDWMWDTEKLVQPMFSKYSHIDILKHVTSRFVGRAFDWWQERQYLVKKGRTSCIWKHFIPPSFRITKAQQVRIEDFIDIGDAFIQNIDKFSRLEKDFKHNLDLLLSEQRKREKYKREQAKHQMLREFDKKREKEALEKLCAKREQEKREINEKKKREEEEKAKEESLRKAKEENERKELEEREKIKQESNLAKPSQVVELKCISKERTELCVRDLVINSSPIPNMKIPFSKGVFPSLTSTHFSIKSFVLFSFQNFCSPSQFFISSSSTCFAKTHFDIKILFKNHLSQSVKHFFCEVGLIPSFSILKGPFSQIFHPILLHGLYDFNSILFDDYCRFVFDPGGTIILVAVSL